MNENEYVHISLHTRLPDETAHAKERPQHYKLQNFLICLMLVVMTAQILLQPRSYTYICIFQIVC